MTLSLTSFGQLMLTRGTEEVDLRTRKHLGLILFLALSPDRRHQREVLADLFWEGPGNRPRRSLNQAVYEIRERASVEILSTRDWLFLPREECVPDTDLLLRAIEVGGVADILHIYQGWFAPCLGRAAGVRLERWVDETRSYYHGLVVRTLRTSTERYRRDNDTRALEWLTQGWRRRFPLDSSQIQPDPTRRDERHARTRRRSEAS